MPQFHASFSAIEVEGRKEGWRKGMREGRKEGRRKGMREGWRKGMREGKKEGRRKGMREGRKEGRINRLHCVSSIKKKFALAGNTFLSVDFILTTDL
ncbi:hypothetical protein FHG87_011460 [Trinorchestia longiramus]|nr:hypothetical protein FHG87_011460 [Trinorchestia longiramus]